MSLVFGHHTSGTGQSTIDLYQFFHYSGTWTYYGNTMGFKMLGSWYSTLSTLLILDYVKSATMVPSAVGLISNMKIRETENIITNLSVSCGGILGLVDSFLAYKVLVSAQIQPYFYEPIQFDLRSIDMTIRKDGSDRPFGAAAIVGIPYVAILLLGSALAVEYTKKSLVPEEEESSVYTGALVYFSALAYCLLAEHYDVYINMVATPCADLFGWHSAFTWQYQTVAPDLNIIDKDLVEDGIHKGSLTYLLSRKMATTLCEDGSFSEFKRIMSGGESSFEGTDVKMIYTLFGSYMRGCKDASLGMGLERVVEIWNIAKLVIPGMYTVIGDMVNKFNEAGWKDLAKIYGYINPYEHEHTARGFFNEWAEGNLSTIEGYVEEPGLLSFYNDNVFTPGEYFDDLEQVVLYQVLHSSPLWLVYNKFDPEYTATLGDGKLLDWFSSWTGKMGETGYFPVFKHRYKVEELMVSLFNDAGNIPAPDTNYMRALNIYSVL